ncbi:MAG: hypothetical protein E7632_11170 [Ruminococcaceae bacterium]|nr:hypothetical protein [Oscillospiraceae bacterium]
MEFFIIDKPQTIRFPKCADHPILRDFLDRFTLGLPWNILREHEELVITVGDYTEASRGDNEYALNITPAGVYISGRDYNGLIRGLLTFMQKIICYDKLVYKAECGCFCESPAVGVRSVHLCIFPNPETTFPFLQKAVRLAAMAKYSHVILEFWGSIRLDSFPQMAWPHAYTKAQVRELVAEIRALGMEIIPFVQHLGHAAMARQGASGKHVVLDQAPELEYLYKPGFDGWVWDYSKPVVRELLRNIRNELMELCGEGGYFAIGCDEADDLGQGEDGLAVAAELCEYLNGVQEELSAVGRRVIMWGDMLFSRADFKIDKPQPGEFYEGNSNHTFAEAMQNGLDKRIVIADWEYNIVSEEWKTAIAFKEKGFDVLCASFSGMTNIQTAIDTVKHHQLLGYMKTTWARIFREMGYVTYAGEAAWKGECWPNYPAYAKTVSRTFGLVRKICPCPDYKDAGWSPKQIEPSLH